MPMVEVSNGGTTLPELVAVQTSLNYTTPITNGEYYMVHILADTRITVSISGATVLTTTSDVLIRSYNAFMRGYIIQATSSTLSISSSTSYGYIVFKL